MIASRSDTSSATRCRGWPPSGSSSPSPQPETFIIHYIMICVFPFVVVMFYLLVDLFVNINNVSIMVINSDNNDNNNIIIVIIIPGLLRGRLSLRPFHVKVCFAEHYKFQSPLFPDTCWSQCLLSIYIIWLYTLYIYMYMYKYIYIYIYIYITYILYSITHTNASSIFGRASHRQRRVGGARPQERVLRPAGVRHLRRWNSNSLPNVG